MKSVLGLLLLVLACCAQADTLWLKNGDRLSGRLLYLDTKVVSFRLTSAGRVSIKRSKIRALETSVPVNLTWGPANRLQVSRIRLGEANALLLDDGTVLALDQLNHAVRPRLDKLGWQWEGRGTLSADLQKDPDEETRNARFKLDTRLFNLRWRHEWKADYEYETEDGESNERNYTLEYNLDYFVARPWFVRINGLDEHDYFDLNRRDTEYGGGVGYQFRDDAQGRLNVTLQYLRYRLAYDLELDDGILPLTFRLHALGVSWDFEHFWRGSDLELFSNGRLAYPDRYDIDHVLTSESGLRFHVNTRINLSLRLEYDQLQQDRITSTERRILIGIGASW